MLRALRDGYFGILVFRGRMAIGAFWIFTGVNVALTTLALSIAFGSVFQQFAANAAKVAATHPEDVTIRQGPGSYSISVEGNHPGIMPDTTGFVWTAALLALIFFALTAAAATRRLHDTGRSGAWILLPVPFLAFGLVQMPGLFAQFGSATGDPPLGQFALLFANNLVYLLCLLVVAIFLGLPGNTSANRYGPPPGAAED
jgi:uncharacterized membrane protein YhaH (DUF805 family)